LKSQLLKASKNLLELVVSLCFAGFSAPSFGMPPQGFCQGTVRDAQGDVLAGAVVELRSSGWGQTLHSFTDQSAPLFSPTCPSALTRYR